MADRYWIAGGGGIWNTTNTAVWSDTSGGTGGASVPTAADNVIFNNALGGGYIVTMTGALACLDFTVVDGLSVVFATGTAPTLTISGNLSFESGSSPTWNNTGTITFNATSSKTIRTGAIVINSSITFNGVGGTWTLLDNLNLASTRTITLTAGTLNQGTSDTITAGFLNVSGSTARTLAISYIELTGNGGTMFTAATSTNLTVTDPDGGNADRAIRVNNSGAVATTIASGALSESNSISFQFVMGTYTLTFLGTAGYTCRNLMIDGFTGTWAAINTGIIYGSVNIAAGGCTIAASTSALTFAGTNGDNKNINIPSRTLDFPVTFNGVGSLWTTPYGLTLGATRALSFVNGVIDFNYTNYTQGASVTLTTGTITLYNFTCSIPFTHTSGTNILGTGCFYYTYTFTAGTLTLTGALTCQRFISSGSGARTIGFGDYGNITVLGDWNNTVVNPIWDTSTTTGLVTTSTTGVNKNVYIRNNNVTNTAFTVASGAMTEAQAISFNFDDGPSTGGSGTYTLTFLGTAGYTARDVVFGAGATITWAAIAACTIYGGLSLTSTMTLTASTSALTFGGTGLFGTKTIACWGKAIDCPVVFNGIGSTWSFYNALTVGATRSVTLTNGTFDNTANPNITGAASVILLTGTFNLGGSAISNGITFTHTSGTLILNSATDIGAAYTFTAGTLNLNNQVLTVPSFNGSGATARTIAFGTSGSITCTGSGTAWTTATITNLTITGTNPLVNITNSTTTATSVLSGALVLASSISFTFSGGAYTLTFLGTTGYTARDINFTNFIGTWAAIAVCTVYGNVILGASMTYTTSANALTLGATSAKTITANYNAYQPVSIPFPITFNGVGGSWTLQDTLQVASTVTLTAGTLNLNGQRLTPNAFNASGSTARTVAFSGASDILCLGANGTLFTTATSTLLTVTGTPNVGINPVGTGAVTVASSGTEAQSFNFSFYNGATSPLTFLGTAGYSARDVDFTSCTGTWTATSTGTIYGNLTLNGSITLTASPSAMTFAGTSGTKTITTAAKTIDFPLTFNGAGSTFKLLDALTMGTTRTLTHTNGTIDLNGQNLTVGTSYTTAAGTKQLIFNNGILYCPSAGATAFNNAVPAGFSIGDGQGSIYLTNAAAKTFVGGAVTYPIGILITGGGVFTLTGNNDIKNMSTNYSNSMVITGSNTFRSFETQAFINPYTLTSGTTQTFDVPFGSAYQIGGSGSTIASSVAGSPAYFYKKLTSLGGNYGNNVVVATSTSIRDIAFIRDPALASATIDGSGTVPSKYFTSSSCINLGGNYGVLFSGYTVSNQVSTIVISNTAATSWNPPADWNSANNIIHIFGAGGGGAGARLTSTTNKSGGGGGGGGGYTKILNYSATVGTPVSVTIGAVGSGGAATVNGTAGGNTVFGIYSANGGAGGTTTATPTAPGGAGGTGGTFNGGNGGNGANTVVLNAGAGGGGGGGGGGLSGNGGNGGNGFASATAAQNAGGGGGGNGGGTAGANGASTKGGNGGNGASGTGPTGGSGAGPSANTATGAGGAGGASTGAGGSGAFGSDILGTFGGSGGMGASATIASSGTAFFGGGGGAGGGSNTTVASAGSNGGRGLVVIQYYPTAAYGTPSTTGSFFNLF